ncbi:MAG: response regulator, partial [Parvibaculum sp.]|nr:response regulator [Parvibaculum sp.]
GQRMFSSATPWRLNGKDANGGSGGPGDRAGDAPDDARPLAGQRILVVEDEFFVGLEIAQTLEAAGAAVTGPLRSLEDAEDMAAENSFDMAVLDVNLDGKYALNLALDLRRRGTRVVFATAHADDTHLFQGEAAAIPRLSKPTRARTLLRALLPLT